MTDTSFYSTAHDTCVSPVDYSLGTLLENLTSLLGVDLRHFQPLSPEIHRWHTKEGAQVHLVPIHDWPVFDLVLRFKAGSAADGDTPGLAALALYTLDQGTGDLDAARFADRLEGLGATLDRKISQDYAIVSLRGLSTPALRDGAMQLVTAMVAKPAFRDADIGKIRERLVNYHRSNTRSARTLLFEETARRLFSGHPYATSPAGTPEGLAGITPEQVVAFHRKAYSAQNLEIGLVGDLSLEEAETLVASLTQALPRQWMSITPAPLPLAKAQPLHIERSGASTTVLLTLPLHTYPTDTDYPALLMADEMLGGSFESRLTAELRTRRALTYTVSSNLVPMDAGCLWHIMWEVQPQYRDASQALVSNLVNCFIQHGPSLGECEFALNQTAGKLLRAMANSAALAIGLVNLGNQNLPADHLATLLDKLATLTSEDIRQAARGLNMQHACFASLGPSVEQQPLPTTATIGEPTHQ